MLVPGHKCLLNILCSCDVCLFLKCHDDKTCQTWVPAHAKLLAHRAPGPPKLHSAEVLLQEHCRWAAQIPPAPASQFSKPTAMPLFYSVILFVTVLRIWRNPVMSSTRGSQLICNRELIALTLWALIAFMQVCSVTREMCVTLHL